ncbi:DUF2029 domain-containing protein [Pyxidicoccus parkwayensis]|uniref:DUF2029 domain-containing protein n=1 Tax=Pyxidicoccus parkwayensis TaxID=2813578 RepID=A0ABX7P3M6_9BACT|nr:DUF2029 domain-containing protein [Pyxidicoccus parkwaysis]QSQ25079.1 DUF2029 domain-containing protein [Pyxidicoccus parkwaysis]
MSFPASPTHPRATSPAHLVRRGVSSLLLAAASGWVVQLNDSALRLRTVGRQVAFVLGVLALAALLYRWGIPGVRRQLERFTRKQRWAWLGTCGLVAGILLVALPLHYRPPPVRLALTVTATGERNPSSLGSEVWVLELLGEDGTPLPMQKDWHPDAAWELRDGKHWLAQGSRPARLEWEGLVSERLVLKLVSHPYSGIVEYSWNGQTTRVDLFAAQGGQRDVTLPVSHADRGAGAILRQVAFYAAHALVLGFLLLAMGLWLEHLAPPRGLSVSPRWAALVTALPVMAVAGMWLLAVFPGMMSSDSTSQWTDALSGNMDEAHPLFHTFTIRLLQKVWESPAMVALAQILALGAVLAWAGASLARAGSPRWVIVLTGALMALAPINGTLVVTLWKDIPFSICVLALCVLAFRTATRTDGRWGIPFWAGLVALGTMTLLFRHNGPPAVAGAFLALAVLKRSHYKALAVAFVATFLLASGTRAALKRTYQIRPFVEGMTLVGFLGAHVANGTPLEPGERALLEEIHPMDDKWHYWCASNVPTIWDGRFSMDALSIHSKELLPLLIRLTRRDPEPILSHVVCSSSVLWKLSQGTDHLNGPTIWLRPDGEVGTIEPNEKVLRTEPVLPALGSTLLHWTVRTLEPDLSWLIWRPALPLYLLLLSCALACVRSRNWRFAWVSLPIVLHTVALGALIPSPDVRYQYPVFLVALMFAPAWLAGLTAGAAAPMAPAALPTEEPAAPSARQAAALR